VVHGVSRRVPFALPCAGRAGGRRHSVRISLQASRAPRTGELAGIAPFRGKMRAKMRRHRWRRSLSSMLHKCALCDAAASYGCESSGSMGPRAWSARGAKVSGKAARVGLSQREGMGCTAPAWWSSGARGSAGASLGPPFAIGWRKSSHGHCVPWTKQASSCTQISSRGTKAFRDASAKKPVDRVISARGLFFAVQQVNEAVRA
jgi:hypothetical protein